MSRRLCVVRSRAAPYLRSAPQSSLSPPPPPSLPPPFARSSGGLLLPPALRLPPLLLSPLALGHNSVRVRPTDPLSRKRPILSCPPGGALGVFWGLGGPAPRVPRTVPPRVAPALLRGPHGTSAFPRWLHGAPQVASAPPRGHLFASYCLRFANPHQPILKQPLLRSALVIGSCRSVTSA